MFKKISSTYQKPESPSRKERPAHLSDIFAVVLGKFLS